MLFLGGFQFGAFAGDDADELAGGGGPIGEEVGGLLGAGLREMEFDEGFHLGDVLRAANGHGYDHLGIDAGLEFSVDVIDEGGATGHSGSEVFAGPSEDDDGSVGHVFAAMVADAFDDGGGTRVTDGESFAGAAVGEKVTAGSSVEAGISGDGVFGGFEAGVGGDAKDDLAGGHAFADVVVGLADEFEGDAIDEEGTEGLASGSVAGDMDGTGGEAMVFEYAGDRSRETGADVTVGVYDVVSKLGRGAVG